MAPHVALGFGPVGDDRARLDLAPVEERPQLDIRTPEQALSQLSQLLLRTVGGSTRVGRLLRLVSAPSQHVDAALVGIGQVTEGARRLAHLGQRGLELS